MLLRRINRNRLAFSLKLLGITVGLTCVFLTYLWINDELQVDQFLQKGNGPYQLIMHFDSEGEISTGFSTPCLLAETIEAEFPEVAHSVELREYNDITFSIDSSIIKANGYHAGSQFFNVFNFDLLEGSPENVLSNHNSIVLSKTLAHKLFGTSINIIGQPIKLQNNQIFTISGVVDIPSPKTTLVFDFLIPFDDFKLNNQWSYNWNYSTVSTYIGLGSEMNISEFNTKIASYLNNKRDANQLPTTLEAIDYTSMYLYSRFENGKIAGGRIQNVKILGIVSILILLITCINFINLTTAIGIEKAKEIAVKKVIGISRQLLLLQLFGETLLVVFFSLLLSLGLTIFTLPLFNRIAQKNIEWSFDFHQLAFAGGIALLTALLAGSYPALLIARFKTATILKSNNSIPSSKGFNLRQALVVGQYIISFVMIIVVVVIYQQIDFLHSKHLGYNQSNLIQFEMNGKIRGGLSPFLAEVNKIEGVNKTSSIGKSLVGERHTYIIEEWPGKANNNVAFEMRAVNFEMLETLDIPLVAGRYFSSDFHQENRKMILNERAIQFMGFEESPIGQIVKMDGDQYEIIGISKDFHFTSLKEDIGPLFFVYRPSWTNKIIARLTSKDKKVTIDQIKELHQSYNPGFIFDFEFLDDSYRSQYRTEGKVASIIKYLAFIALFMSCIGLFGLASFNTKRRFKEIGIRKVLGASVSKLTVFLSADFLRLTVLAVLIASPIAWQVVTIWLRAYAFRIEINLLLFLGVGVGLCFITLLTVGYLAFKAARINPVLVIKA